jgi:hypothetical protein
VAAALRPDRVTGLVSVNGYLIQDISAAMQPLRPDLEAGFWYFFYFLTDPGRAGLTANRRDRRGDLAPQLTPVGFPRRGPRQGG